MLRVGQLLNLTCIISTLPCFFFQKWEEGKWREVKEINRSCFITSASHDQEQGYKIYNLGTILVGWGKITPFIPAAEQKS